MYLSRLYTNRPDIFVPVDFREGLNVVLAEIRLPENRQKDTHNLGKTTVGRLIDFCLLSEPKPKFFLFKHEDLFREFLFFLEIGLLDGSYVTVRRSIAEATKISFRRHQSPGQNFIEFLDGMLDLRTLEPYSYRKSLGYLLRLQDDYKDVFQLSRHAGKHLYWKPFLAHWLGFDAEVIEELYRKEDDLEKQKTAAETVKAELGGTVEDFSKIEGLILLKQKDVEKKQKLLDSFDFRAIDKSRTKTLVDDVDARIASLNAERYSLNAARKRIVDALAEERVRFDPTDAEKIFAEAGVVFPGQIKRDFEQLIEFNRAIYDERRSYLEEERGELDGSIQRLNNELNELGKQRSAALSFLGETDVFNKYRQVADKQVTLKADLTDLLRQRGYLHRLQELRAQIRELETARTKLQSAVEKDIEQQNTDQESRFSLIRLYFSEIVEDVIDRKALLRVAPNKEGHPEFNADILDEAGKATSADDGHTYRKLLCAAFDMALLRAHLAEKAPRFLYHDGIFESLDDRKKLNLVAVMRRYADLGIQFVVTLIDSDLPKTSPAEPVFNHEEIVLRLHDEGPEGRLFRMKSW